MYTNELLSGSAAVQWFSQAGQVTFTKNSCVVHQCCPVSIIFTPGMNLGNLKSSFIKYHFQFMFGVKQNVQSFMYTFVTIFTDVRPAGEFTFVLLGP